MKIKKLMIGLVILSMSFGVPKIPDASSKQEEKITHAFLGDDSSTFVNELHKKNSNVLFQTTYFESYYFGNLKTNFGNNIFGTCTYVSMGMLFSFYDTYYDDNMIPVSFEKNIEVQSNDVDQFVLSNDSPGILREPDEIFSNVNSKEYLDMVDKMSDQYFQFKLLSLSKEKFGKAKFESKADPFGMSYEEMIDFIKYYLYDFLQYEEPEVDVESVTDNSRNIIDFVRNNVSKGNPVILRTGDFGGHSFVVYDFDERTGEYFAHTGLVNSLTDETYSHYSLGNLSDLDLWDATTLSLNTMHSHTGHYIVSTNSTEKKICPCSYVKPRNATVSDNAFRDVSPTFYWTSLIKDKWYRYYDPYFEIQFLDANKNTILTKNNIHTFEFKPSMAEWDLIITKQIDTFYYVKIQVKTYHLNLLNDCYIIEKIKKPTEFQSVYSIKPSEYGFADEYPTDEATKINFKEHAFGNGSFKFQTRRYRTGYIHNECLVMSPIREGISEAFIEYRFDMAINKLDVQLSHWREQTSELLTKDNGKAVLQCFKGKEWVDSFDLLSNETNLQRDRNDMSFYRIEFGQPTYRIRFYSCYYLKATNSNNNKGRICIGNIKVYPSKFSMPLSGSELDYDPVYWNTKTITTETGKKKALKSVTNCYSYALNAEWNPNDNRYNPILFNLNIGGHACASYYKEKENLMDAVNNDAKLLGIEMNEINGKTRCKYNTYKIAICFNIASSSYHFYRQNSDGTWSHKLGVSNVTNCDASNDVIMDPEKANRNYSDVNFETFAGYFEVTPLNSIKE